MASSFKGWGESWAATWDRVTDPGAMYGSASFSITATGALTSTGEVQEPIYGGSRRSAPVRKRENDEALLLFVL